VKEEKTGNEFIDGEDYFSGYTQKQAEPDSEILDYQALTYRLFGTNEGMKWLETTKDVMSAKMIEFSSGESHLALAEAQGMRRAILDIYKLLATHQSYINGS
jgi:hypothetical protein